MVSQCVSSSIWGFVRLGRGTAALVAPVQLGAAVRKQMVNRVRITARSASFTQAPDPILPYPRNMFSPLSKADQAHWLSVLEKLRNPRAVSLASQLDTACVLGVGEDNCDINNATWLWKTDLCTLLSSPSWFISHGDVGDYRQLKHCGSQEFSDSFGISRIIFQGSFRLSK